MLYYTKVNQTMTIRPMNEREIPTVQLTGTDGNAFAAIGAVRSAIHRAAWTPEEMTEVMDDMMNGDYNHLLNVAMTVCEVD